MNLPKPEPFSQGATKTDPAHDPVLLLNALLDRALLECDRGVERIAARDAEGKGNALHCVLEIVEALVMALDHSVAPELCSHLESLYLYVQERVETANRTFDAAPIADAVKVLCVLQQAFAQAARACGPEPIGSASPAEHISGPAPDVSEDASTGLAGRTGGRGE